MTIKHIVMAGGAYNGIYMVGVLKKLISESFFDIDNIKTIYGTSVGGLIGAILCLKEDWKIVVNYILDRPWDQALDLDADMLLEMIPNKGILDMSFMKLFFQKLLKAKHLSPEITLEEFYQYSNIKLVIFAVDANTFNVVKISYETHPNLSLIKAIHITCAIPFIFQPVYFDALDTYLIDGGTVCNYPLDYCIQDVEEKNEILGINFKLNKRKGKMVTKDTNLFHYGYHIFDKLVGITRNKKYEEIPNQIIIPCDATTIATALEIVKNKELRKKYIDNGEIYGDLFLNYHKKLESSI
jgi:predicted acylesterase/phospholipase RssA